MEQDIHAYTRSYVFNNWACLIWQSVEEIISLEFLQKLVTDTVFSDISDRQVFKTEYVAPVPIRKSMFVPHCHGYLGFLVGNHNRSFKVQRSPWVFSFLISTSYFWHFVSSLVFGSLVCHSKFGTLLPLMAFLLAIDTLTRSQRRTSFLLWKIRISYLGVAFSLLRTSFQSQTFMGQGSCQ